MLISFTRTLILYALVVIVMRVMGKRQIGEMQPFELVIAIMIADLAAVPMQDVAIPLVYGIVPILTLLVAQLTLSYLTLKSEKARSIVCGTPTILIENGKLMEEEMKTSRCNLNDLLEQLRLNNLPNIEDVEFAILETCGQVSVIPKSKKRPLTPEDLEMVPAYEGLPMTLIMDGQLNYPNLEMSNINEEQLTKFLHQQGYSSPKQIFFASLDSSGKVFLQPKNNG